MAKDTLSSLRHHFYVIKSLKDHPSMEYLLQWTYIHIHIRSLFTNVLPWPSIDIWGKKIVGTHQKRKRRAEKNVIRLKIKWQAMNTKNISWHNNNKYSVSDYIRAYMGVPYTNTQERHVHVLCLIKLTKVALKNTQQHIYIYIVHTFSCFYANILMLIDRL